MRAYDAFLKNVDNGEFGHLELVVKDIQIGVRILELLSKINVVR